MSETRSEVFSSRWGMLLAMLGMAVRTGNIWRFPRIAASNGGGSFLVAWAVFLLLWSVPLLILEFGMGKGTRKGAIGSFIKTMGPGFAWMGAWVAFVTLAIMCYYSAITGWCLRYLLFFAGGTFADAATSPQAVWNGFVGDGLVGSPVETLVFHGLAIGLARGGNLKAPFGAPVRVWPVIAVGVVLQTFAEQWSGTPARLSVLIVGSFLLVVASLLNAHIKGAILAGIVAGEYYTCALTSANQVRCWGDNPQGQLGDNSRTRRAAPTSSVLSNVSAIAAGLNHTCALQTDGDVFCWGDNEYGQIGNGGAATADDANVGSELLDMVVSLGGRRVRREARRRRARDHCPSKPTDFPS